MLLLSGFEHSFWVWKGHVHMTNSKITRKAWCVLWYLYISSGFSLVHWYRIWCCQLIFIHNVLPKGNNLGKYENSNILDILKANETLKSAWPNVTKVSYHWWAGHQNLDNWWFTVSKVKLDMSSRILRTKRNSYIIGRLDVLH